MFKILIIDDEKLVRKAIISRIDTEKLNIEKIYEASDGNKAFEITKNINPDIVLLDMKMKIASGLDYLSKFQKADLDSKIIVISGYKDFELAKEIIKYDVIDFLTKPVNKHLINSVLAKTFTQIEKSKNEEIYLLSIKNNYKDSNKKLQNVFINSLLHKNKVNFSLDFIPKNKLFKLIIISSDKSNYSQKISNESGILTEDTEVFSFTDSSIENQSGFLIFFNNEESSINNRIISYVKETDLYDKIKYLGISDTIKNIEEIDKCYKTLLNTIKTKIFNDKKLFVETICQKAELSNKISEKFKFIESAIEEGNYKTAEHYLHFLFSKKTLENNIFILSEVLKAIHFILSKFPVEHQSLLDDIVTSEYILRKKSIQEILDDLSLLLKEAITNIKDNTSNKKITEKIKEYINNNYDREISLSSISEEMYLNSSYVSQLFKKETSINITMYIENVRIEKAKELLENPYITIKEVAYLIGYNDSGYFSKVFKKNTGKSPKNYQSNL